MTREVSEPPASRELAQREASSWMGVSERGSMLAMRALMAVVNLFGRRPARVLLTVIAFYFTLLHGCVRRASQDFLRRLGEEAGFWASYRHILRFAQCALDRVFFLRGCDDLFEIELFGHDLIMEASSRQRGSILLSAHLGSFEVMRLAASVHSVPINVVMNTDNTRMYNAIISMLDPAGNIRIVDVGQGGLHCVLLLRAAIDRGELVAIMGDRVGATDRATEVPFLGAPARFPTGTFFLAASLKCPVYLTFGLYRGGNRYDLHCERFAKEVVLPRGERAASASAYVEKYASRLAHYCRRAPHNWFNFFAFWSTE